MSHDPFVELRGDVPREIIDVIDAVVQASPGASRMVLVRAILAAWCEKKVHEASLVTRIRRGNGSASDAEWKPSGFRAA